VWVNFGLGENFAQLLLEDLVNFLYGKDGCIGEGELVSPVNDDRLGRGYL